jgi:hypothetical protein
MRTVTGAQELTVHVENGATVEGALRKFFNYYPASRAEVFDICLGRHGERMDSTGTPWFVANRLLRRQADVARAAQRQRFQLHRRASSGIAPWRRGACLSAGKIEIKRAEIGRLE